LTKNVTACVNNSNASIWRRVYFFSLCWGFVSRF